jgi:hypothetical protein
MKILDWRILLMTISIIFTYIALTTHIEKLEPEKEEEPKAEEKEEEEEPKAEEPKSPVDSFLSGLSPIEYKDYSTIEKFMQTAPIGVDKWSASKCDKKCPVQIFVDDTKINEQVECKFNCTSYMSGGCDELCGILPDSDLCVNTCGKFRETQLPLIQQIKEAD